MMILFKDLRSCSDAFCEENIKQVSAQRIEKVTRLRFAEDRISSLAAYLLLMQGLKDGYGIDTAPVFIFGPNGKPSLADRPDIHFSLSHTRGASLCVLDPAPVGADVEQIKPFDPELLHSVCCPKEIGDILSSPCSEAAFARCWTRKESFLKLLGCGIRDTEQVKCTPTENDSEFVFDSFSDPSGCFVYSVCRRKQDIRDANDAAFPPDPET